ncbi:hypothetical protein O6H91_03G085000 [Diphasiastrum complanatum]|uniref:Uncharacterized protein n=2 Tax=Diphasiastrum complanatum TaxID=34168 RepID=A0ACC2E8W3_DIPCM|nr:hypothetical protein O6H91_03G085000 [Diphasiastrum complanatum]KAJ7562810.1 hypothetical protein O6H91_03G085000 [Diphasiastrum complanatum]
MSTVSALGNRTLDQLKVPELKEELRKRGILPKGLKKELIERLEQALREEGQVGNFRTQYVHDASEDGPDVSVPQEVTEFAFIRENDASNVDYLEVEKRLEPEVSTVPPQSVSMDVKPESLLVETLYEAEGIKTVHPMAESVEAINLPKERKSAPGTSLLVTTGFEIASSAGMETDVIVQSVPGFSHDSDLLPETLCEAGTQSHPELSASQVSASIHQMGDSVDKLGKDPKVDQSCFILMQSEGQNELKSGQVMVVESVVPSEKVDEGNALLTSSIHPESELFPEVSQRITDGVPPVAKASTEMNLNHVTVDLSKAGIDLSGISDPSLLESKPLAETFEEKFVKPSTVVRAVESLIPEEIAMEDKTVETLIPEQISMEEKTVNEESSMISDTTIATSDSLTAVVPAPLVSATVEAFGGGTKTQKDMVSGGREDRRTEPRRQFEEKIRSREVLDVQREERDIKRSDREAPRDKRELSRSRLSQEGIAKVKEEVEKATTKDRGRVESGFRRSEPRVPRDSSEPRVPRDSIEEKVDSRIIKEELGGKGDLRRVDDESKARDVKPMEVDSEVQAGFKRKESGEDLRQVEPLKRQRRWNSGKNLEAEPEVKPSTKSMTTERAKDSVPYVKTETGNASLPVSMPSPASSIAASKGPVPAPTRYPTTSLRIDRFLRPFTLNAVKELLAQTGTCTDFWMDHIKSHCYVTYSTVEEAIATRNAVYNLQWPPVGGKMLAAEFVDPEEVKLKCESANDKHTIIAVASPRAAASLNDQIASFAGRIAGNVPVPTFAPPPPPPPPHREKPTLPPKKEQEPAIPTLDDLFKKTRAKPHIYYLPLTEEQVTAKFARSKPSITKLTSRA